MVLWVLNRLSVTWAPYTVSGARTRNVRGRWGREGGSSGQVQDIREQRHSGTLEGQDESTRQL